MVLPTASKKKKIIFSLVFIFCLFIQVIPVIRSGLKYNYGLGFWGPNGHDAVWHLGLINNISNPFKINLPIFSGEILKNYHPFFDVFIAYLSKMTFINSSFWLFQLFPLISASLFLIFSFKLGQSLTHKFSTGIFLMLLNTLANSFGWIITLIRNGNFSGESLFWAMQSPSNQLNPPYALSILLLLILIYLLRQKKVPKFWVFLILLFLPVIKVYSAIPAFIIFFFYVLKNKKYILTFTISLLSAFLLFSVYNSTSSSLIKFQPFWFVNSMIESPDRFYLPQVANMRYTLEASGKIGPRLVLYYLIAISIFYIGNFAWRLLSYKEFFKDKAILISILICSLIPLFFIQQGTSWNTIQFLYYALFLANIPFSIYLTQHFRQGILVIALNLLPLISFLPNYLGTLPPTTINNNEINALNFLKKQKSGTVLTVPYDSYLKKNLEIKPLPIYAYETTSYVAAFSEHTVYLEDEMNLENSGYNWKTRREQSLSFFDQKNQFTDRGFLVNNQIDYIYFTKNNFSKNYSFSPQMYLELIFDNPEISIYKVKR